MLNDIGHIDVAARHPGSLQRAVEHPAGGSDERLTRYVLPITGLLSNQHHRGTGGPEPKTVCVASA